MKVKLAGRDQALDARPGDSIAAAMIDAGIEVFRQTESGKPRGLFCGMGVCQECRVHIAGRGTIRACMSPLTEAVEIQGQGPAVRPDAPSQESPGPVAINAAPDVLVVGAGPAGLAAAEASAARGLSVVVLDERPKAGGQYFKQPTEGCAARRGRAADRQARSGRALIDRAEAAGAFIVNEAMVWGADPPRTLYAHIQGSSVVFNPKQLILATGAYERAVPFPGWTEPGVMTTGAAQTLLRAYGVLPGQRIIVAGNGPLNIQVASELLRSGAEVVAVVEAAPLFAARNLALLAGAARHAPGLVAKGLSYIARLRAAAVPILTGSAVTAVEKTAAGLKVKLAEIDPSGHPKAATALGLQADNLCIGPGFLPSVELSRLLGCAHEFDRQSLTLKVRRTEAFETTVPGLFAVGDAAGIEGAQAAMAQGRLAGLAAANSARGTKAPDSERASSQRLLARHRRFQAALWQAFRAPFLALQFADDDTLICRCEEVTIGAVKASIQGGQLPGNIKRATRAGMGHCQGRYCSWLLLALLGEQQSGSLDESAMWAPRPPVRPLSMQAMAGLDAISDDGTIP